MVFVIGYCAFGFTCWCCLYYRCVVIVTWLVFDLFVWTIWFCFIGCLVVMVDLWFGLIWFLLFVLFGGVGNALCFVLLLDLFGRLLLFGFVWHSGFMCLAFADRVIDCVWWRLVIVMIFVCLCLFGWRFLFCWVWCFELVACGLGLCLGCIFGLSLNCLLFWDIACVALIWLMCWLLFAVLLFICGCLRFA